MNEDYMQFALKFLFASVFTIVILAGVSELLFRLPQRLNQSQQQQEQQKQQAEMLELLKDIQKSLQEKN